MKKRLHESTSTTITRDKNNNTRPRKNYQTYYLLHVEIIEKDLKTEVKPCGKYSIILTPILTHIYIIHIFLIISLRSDF